MTGAPVPAETAPGPTRPTPSGSPNTPAERRGAIARRRFRTFGLLALIFTGLCGVVLLGLNARDQLHEMRTAGMNVQWTASQLEVDVLRLALALRDAETAVAAATDSGDRLAEVRLRFDIFYSRVNAITRGAPYRVLGAVPEIVDDLNRARAFDTAMAPRIDAEDATLAADLTVLRQELLQWHVVARRIVMNVLDLFSRSADEDRIAFGDLMASIALLGLGLLVALTALVLILLRLQSRQRRAEVALREARDAALAGQRAKAEFIAVMSHEMRTPLNGTLAALDLAASENHNGASAQLIELARSSAEQLLDQLNDILDIARVEAGRLDIREQPFLPRVVLRDLLTALEPMARARGNRLHLHLDPALPDTLLGDARRIRQILQNLLGNAIKFTEHGEVMLSARSLPPPPASRGDAAKAHVLVFEVSDTGAGIAPADLGRIFDDFVTLETGYERRSRGSGLGLGICRRLAVSMGGTVEVESQPGQGSVFRLFLPLPVAARPDTPASARTAAAAVATRPLRLLVVEDNPTNRLLLARMIRQDGHETMVAANGSEGVALARAQPFDAILMDISMPGMDGLTATAIIRAGGASCQAPVYAVTAHAMPAEQARFRSAGMRVRLRKPIRLAELRELFAEIAAEAGPTGSNRSIDAALPVAPSLRQGAGAAAKPPVVTDPDVSFGTGTGAASGTDAARADLPLIDDRVREAFLGNLDPESLFEIVAQFEADSDRILSGLTGLVATATPPVDAEGTEIESADDGEDRAREIRIRAHEWRGSAATLGCPALADALGALEQAASIPSPALCTLAARIGALPALWLATRAGLPGAASAAALAPPAPSNRDAVPFSAGATDL